MGIQIPKIIRVNCLPEKQESGGIIFGVERGFDRVLYSGIIKVKKQVKSFERRRIKAMEQIIIQVKDKAKAKMLLELLVALDFVNSVKTSGIEEVEQEITEPEESLDFFSLAGLWADREIDLELIREKAWPRQ